MRRRLVRTIVAITALAVVVLSVPLAVAVSGLYHDETVQQLVDDAAHAATLVPAPPLSAADLPEIPPPDDGASVTVYGADGTRVSGAGPARADQVTRDALTGHVTSATTGGEVVAAVPVGAQEQLVAVVRASLPMSAVDDRVHRAWLLMAGFGVAAVGLAAAVALWQARRLSRPLDGLTRAAERLGGGDFTVRIPRSDVPEIDTVASALNLTAGRLSGVLDRERAFSADASHQLRTPLTALRLRLEGALLSGPADGRDAMRAALDEIDRLERTVEDLLRLRRDVPGDRRPLDVARVLGDGERRWRERLAAAGRPLLVTVPSSLASVPVSEAALRQILEVLVDNATKHGGGAVRVSACTLPGGVAVDVGDDGAGVDGDAERIFRRRQTDGGGTGIGLSLARSLAEAEGGRLTLAHAGPAPVFRLVLTTSAR